MAAAVAANKTNQAAAASDSSDKNAIPPAKLVLDPQLLMAARRGDSQRIKELLRLNDIEEVDLASHGNGSTGGIVESAASSEAAVILEVAPDDERPPPAAPAATTPPPPQPLDDDGVTSEGDTLLHVVAESGDSQEFIRCAKMIARYKKHKGGGAAAAVRLALEARNRNGDTPLHRAAGAGNVKMISCLVDLLANAATATATATADEAAVKAFVGRKNRCGETALHQAVRAASKAAIDTLLSVDPELACSSSSGSTAPPPPLEGGSSSSREEDAGIAACSPFFLAVSLWGEHDEMDIARHLFDKTRPSIRSNLSYYCSGPADGRNVLHAAVSRASVKAVVLLSQLLTSVDAQTPHAGLLLSQLASQRDKENGSTPLHLAASLGGLPSSVLLVPPQVRPPPPGATPLWPLVGGDADAASVRVHEVVARLFLGGNRYWQILPLMPSLVLNANVAMAYQPDKRGLYPIHVAAGSGSLRVVEMLLERCPACATLRDAKGRTLLHVAAEEGRSLVVKFVCQQSQKQSRRARPGSAAAATERLAGLLSSILNAQDMNGDTPLHRAVHAGDLLVVRPLIRNRKVRLDVPNNVGMRPIDVSWTTMPLEAYYAWDFRIRIRKSLLQVGAPYGENNRGDLFRKKCVLPNQDEEKKMSENLTAAAQVLALFSVLITTVTFASAFTLPGGSRSASDGSTGGVAGTPLLAGPRRSYAFDAFILADALAFGFSLFATSILLYAGVPAGTLKTRFWIINLAYGLMWHSGRSLLAAFGLGLFLVLLPVARSIAIAVAVLMIVLAVAILKESEGINSVGHIPMIGIGRSREPSPRNVVLGWILFVFNNFWSYVLIFGLPAIRRWPRFTLSPYY